MLPNDLVRRAREQLGLAQSEVARKTGFSAAEYSDIDQHADELVTSVPLAKVKSLCSLLELEISTLLVSAGLGTLTAAVGGYDEKLPRHLLLKKYRELRNASPSDVADAIGFETEAVRRAESDADYLETLPVCVLNDWSKYIGVPLVRMLE